MITKFPNTNLSVGIVIRRSGQKQIPKCFLANQIPVKKKGTGGFRIFPCVLQFEFSNLKTLVFALFPLCISEHWIVRPSHFLFLPMPKHVRMISTTPSSNLTAVEARQFSCALFRQGPSEGSNGMCPTTPSSTSYQYTPTSTSVIRPPTPLSPSVSQTTRSTPQSTDDDKHAFSSIWTSTSQLTDKDKESLTMECTWR